MATKLQSLRENAPFITQVIRGLYRNMGFSFRLKSGKGLRILTSKYDTKYIGFDGVITTDDVATGLLEDIGFKNLGLWNVRYELEFLRENTTDKNYSAKLTEFREKRKISEETYKACRKNRSVLKEKLKKVRKIIRERNIVYINPKTEPFESFVHEKLHDVIVKVGKFKFLKQEHCYIWVVTPYIMHILIDRTKGELKNYLEEDLKAFYVRSSETKNHPKDVKKIIKLYRKNQLSKAELDDLMKSLNYADLSKTIKKIFQYYEKRAPVPFGLPKPTHH